MLSGVLTGVIVVEKRGANCRKCGVWVIIEKYNREGRGHHILEPLDRYRANSYIYCARCTRYLGHVTCLNYSLTYFLRGCFCFTEIDPTFELEIRRKNNLDGEQIKILEAYIAKNGNRKTRSIEKLNHLGYKIIDTNHSPYMIASVGDGTWR